METILGIQEEANFAFASQRQIRHGYMGMVIRISNALQFATQNQEVADFLDNTGDKWAEYANGDLRQRNETNNKKLGGQEPKTLDASEDDEQKFEPMDSIMARFSNFSKASSNNNQDDEEEEAEEFESHTNGFEVAQARDESTGIIEVDMPAHVEVPEYSTNIFWNRKPDVDEDTLDLSDFE